MNIIQTNLAKRVQDEAEKTTLIDTYGSIIGWMKVLADWLLAPAGALLDGLVLFGIFYLAIKNIYAAAFLAIVAAIAIQFLYGRPAAVAASTAFSGRYNNQGEQKLMWMLSGLTAFALAGSLYLSFQSDKLVEAVGEHIYIQESDAEIQARYDGLATAATEQYNADVAALNERIAALQNDKIMWKGNLTTRERSSRKAATLSTQLATVRQQLDNRLQQIEQQRQQSLATLGNKNETTATLFETRIANGGATLKGINVAFNLSRLCIILVFMYFTAAAAEEIRQQKQVVTSVGNTATVEQQTATKRQHLAPAAKANPAPDRPVIKPFGGNLPVMATPRQHSATGVVNTVTPIKQTETRYNITVVNGRPTLPWKYSTKKETAQLSAADVKKRIGIIAKRQPTTNNQNQLEELQKMKRTFEAMV